LARQFGNNVFIHGAKGVDAAQDSGYALTRRHGRPIVLRLARRC
jgi:hypothetical protein